MKRPQIYVGGKVEMGSSTEIKTERVEAGKSLLRKGIYVGGMISPRKVMASAGIVGRMAELGVPKMQAERSLEEKPQEKPKGPLETIRKPMMPPNEPKFDAMDEKVDEKVDEISEVPLEHPQGAEVGLKPEEERLADLLGAEQTVMPMMEGQSLENGKRRKKRRHRRNRHRTEIDEQKRAEIQSALEAASDAAN